jgi:hypothetical protein
VRQIHLIVACTYNGDSFRGFYKFVQERGIDCVDFLSAILEACQSQPGLAELFRAFIAETQSELFNSYEEAEDFYRQEDNFKRLMAGKVGANLLANYSCRTYLEQSSALVEAMSKALRQVARDEDSDAVEDLCRYYALAFDHMFDPRRNDIVQHAPRSGSTAIPSARPSSRGYFERYGRSPQAFGKIPHAALYPRPAAVVAADRERRHRGDSACGRSRRGRPPDAGPAVDTVHSSHFGA